MREILPSSILKLWHVSCWQRVIFILVMETSALFLLMSFFLFQIPISKLLCCPALSSLSSFAWQKHVMFVVNVLDYLVLVLKHYLVPRVTGSSALHITCQLSVCLIIKTEKAIWVDHSHLSIDSLVYYISIKIFLVCSDLSSRSTMLLLSHPS